MLDGEKDHLVDEAYKFIFIFDAEMCIPNMSCHGLPNRLSNDIYFMTQSSIKHKVRDYLHYFLGEKVLHSNIDDHTVLERLGVEESDLLAIAKQCDKEAKTDSDATKKKEQLINDLIAKELEYADVRMFSMLDAAKFSDSLKISISLKKKPGITMSEARSFDPVEIASTSTIKSYKVLKDEDGKTDGTGYGNPKWFIEYGMFMMTGGVDPRAGRFFGLTDGDVDAFFESLWHCFDFDASTLRPAGSMKPIMLVVYKASPEALKLGGRCMNDVFSQILIKRKEDSTGFGRERYDIEKEPAEYVGMTRKFYRQWND